MDIFPYGEKEIAHLCKKDKTLARAIEKIGPIAREVDTDLFSSLAGCIVSQQISTKAANTIWNRMTADMGTVTPDAVCARSLEHIQAYGISFKKASYMRGAAEKIASGEFDLTSLSQLPDEPVVKALVALDGVGVWTAEMLMIFSMLRPNILSFGDLAIHRGMQMLYHHKEIKKPMFETYRKRYAPYGSVASLYLWAIAGGAMGVAAEA